MNSRLDDHARRAARALEERVASAADSRRSLDHLRARRSPNIRPVLVVGVALVLVAAVAVLLIDGEDDDLEIRAGGGEPDTTATTSPSAPPSATTAPLIDTTTTGPLRGGENSVQLPVTVEPATGLLFGDIVSVTAGGFEPNEQVAILMCGVEAPPPRPDEPRGQSAGIAACDLGQVETSNFADAEGMVRTSYAVNSFVSTSQFGRIECTTSPGRCLVAVGALNDYNRSGGAPITFAEDVSSVSPDPSVSAGPTTDLDDPSVVMVTGVGFPFGMEVWVAQCVVDTQLCGEESGAVRIGTDGRLEFPLVVRRMIGEADCAVQECEVLVDAGGGPIAGPFPLLFDR